MLDRRLFFAVLPASLFAIFGLKTLVVFRWWEIDGCEEFPDGGCVSALFPQTLDKDGYCKSFILPERDKSDKGSSFYDGVIRNTKPATFEQYQSTKAELERQGYRLRVING